MPIKINYFSLKHICFSLLLYAQICTASAAAITLNTLQKSQSIKLFTPDKVLHYIRTQRAVPRVLLFSSFDRACKTCNAANRAFYQLSKSKHDVFEFVFVNTHPWRAKELETSLVYRLNNHSPVTVVLHGSRILRRLATANYQKMPRYLAEVQIIIAKNRLPLYGDRLGKGKVNSLVITDKFETFLHKYLQSKDDYKALAVALNKRSGWTASQKVGFLSQRAANYQALQQCTARWRAKGNSGACKLYMMSDQYVYKQSAAQINARLTALPKLATRIDKHVLKLQEKTNHKALAYAVNKTGNWTMSIVSNQKSERRAKQAVLKSCEKQRLLKKLNRPCKLYFLDDKLVRN